MTTKNVAILIFDNAEVLDFAGPFEVFSSTSEVCEIKPFNVFTVARENKSICAVNGLSVNPRYSFKDHPKIDILIVTGGTGSRMVMKDSETLNWVKQVHDTAELVVCICSGSRILGVLGLLDYRQYCTHHQVYDHMAEIVPTGIPVKQTRFIKSTDKIYTSGGISAGIDLSFHVIDEILGPEVSDSVARYMEYARERSLANIY